MLRVYIDTSVVGGCLDKEFAETSQALMRMAESGQIVLLVSNVLVDELNAAPDAVQDVLATMPATHMELVGEPAEAQKLRDAYLVAAIVTATHRNDALHVAIATVARADMIVSWNFKHIVHHDKIRGFNAVNEREGYPPLAIYSPLEVV